MTVEQMVSDAVEVTNYLRTRFDERKIYVVGNSWGTILGVLAAQQHPELYHAFIGSGQMVSPVDTDRMFYEDTLAWARRTGDAALVDDAAHQRSAALRRPLAVRDRALARARLESLSGHGGIPGEGRDARQHLRRGIRPDGEAAHLPGFMDTFAVLYPQLHGIDFREQVASLEIPVYLVQGAHEARGRAVLADEWFAQLDAPDKQRIVFARSGHKALVRRARSLPRRHDRHRAGTNRWRHPMRAASPPGGRAGPRRRPLPACSLTGCCPRSTRTGSNTA